MTGYRDLVEIGRGGFARVYRAHQERFNRPVALKVLDLADPDERTRDRFERECRAMGELSWHPHVVAVYDSGVTDDGHLWLAMEFMPKGSLGDGLSPDATLTWEGAASVGIQVAGALAAAHAAGTLHRDLKPENVLLDVFGEAKLADFGIAAVDGGRRTTTGVASFTVAHVAPEVLRGHRQDERTDVYGLASTLHTLLAGTSPFAGEPDEPVAATMMRIIEAPPPRLAEPVPPALADLLVACLAKDPDDRPQSAADVGGALQSLERDRGVPVTPLRIAAAPSTTPVAPVVPPSSPNPVPIVEPPASLTVEAMPNPRGDDQATVTLAPAQAGGERVPVTTPPPAPPVPRETAPAAPTAPGSDAAAEKSGRGRVLLIVGAVVAVLALVAGAIVLLGGEDGASTAGTFQTEVITEEPSSVAFDDQGVWVTSHIQTEVFRLDVDGNLVTSTGIINAGTGIALTDDDAGWVIASDTRDLVRLDLATNEDTNEIDIGTDMQSISADGTDVWITTGAQAGAGTLVRFDAVALEPTAAIDIGTAPNEVSATDDVVWATSDIDSTVLRIDPDTNEVTATITVDAGIPGAVAAVEDAVWVVNGGADSLTRIDPATNEIVATVEIGDDPALGAVAATSSAVWVTDASNDVVLRIDPATNEVTDTIAAGDQPEAVAATDADVWVANRGDGTLTHIDPAAFT